MWGTFIYEYGSPAGPRILKAAGWDYALIDMEHASLGIETVATLLHVASTIGLPAVVRVPEPERSLLCRPLDAGALGIMVPRVESKAQAEQVVRYTKYTPDGDRSVILGTAHTDYRAVDGKRFIREANAEILTVLQVETVRGLEHLEEILSVPGLDVAYIGPYDLSTSMGIPGDLAHPRMQRAVTAFLQACRRYGVIPGNFVTTVPEGRAWTRRGVRFLTYGWDAYLLTERSRQVLGDLRRKGKAHGRRGD